MPMARFSPAGMRWQRCTRPAVRDGPPARGVVVGDGLGLALERVVPAHRVRAVQAAVVVVVVEPAVLPLLFAGLPRGDGPCAPPQRDGSEARRVALLCTASSYARSFVPHVSLQRRGLNRVLHSSSVAGQPRGSPPRVVVRCNATRCRRRGSCSPSVASHGARGSERSEGADFSSLPSIEARRGEPSRGRETRPTAATVGPRPVRRNSAESTYLIFFLRNSGPQRRFLLRDFAVLAARDDAAGQPTTRSRQGEQPSTHTLPKGAAQAKHSHHRTMATHGTLDVVVHLHRFRNVDLFSRGIYMVRAAVKCNTKQAIPHGCYSKPSVPFRRS